MTRSVLATLSFRKIWYMRTRPTYLQRRLLHQNPTSCQENVGANFGWFAGAKKIVPLFQTSARCPNSEGNKQKGLSFQDSKRQSVFGEDLSRKHDPIIHTAWKIFDKTLLAEWTGQLWKAPLRKMRGRRRNFIKCNTSFCKGRIGKGEVGSWKNIETLQDRARTVS